MDTVVDDSNIIAAARTLMKEPDKAKGPDRKTVEEVCKPLLEDPVAREELRKQLLQGSYRPGPIRTTYIPKPNGKKRKLGIANVLDRVVQRMILQAVMAVTPANTWSESSFAYRPGLGIPDAVKKAEKHIAAGATHAVSVDLRSFFDNVPHHRLMRKLSEHISDKRVVRLVRKLLTPIVLDWDMGTKTVNRIGAPQGSIISPWLTSMLYLDELDRELELRALPFVRYADDVTVFCWSEAAAKRVRARIVRYLEEVMQCPVNQDKTKAVPVGSLSMLGLYRSGLVWKIQRKKEHDACANAVALLQRYMATGDIRFRCMAEWKFNGWLQHYRRIPNLEHTKIPKLERWFERKLKRADEARGEGGFDRTPFD